MNAEETIRELHKVESEHKNDKVLTFGIRIADMARDCANTIEELQAEVASLTAQLAELDRLRAENADLRAKLDDPRTVTLPCAVGDTIWRPDALQYSWDIVFATVYPDEIVFTDDSDNVFTADDLGKTVFLTREAAEAAKEATPHD
jgi:hypothetical protein